VRRIDVKGDDRIDSMSRPGYLNREMSEPRCQPSRGAIQLVGAALWRFELQTYALRVTPRRLMTARSGVSVVRQVQDRLALAAR